MTPEKVQTGMRRGSYLENRRNFMRVVSVGVGVPFTLALFWMFGSYGGAGWWLFLAVLAFLTARISAFVLWFVFKNVYAIDESEQQ